MILAQPSAHDPIRPRRRAALPAERIRLALLWLTGASGAIVFVEPSPYEFFSFLAIVVFAAGGLALRLQLVPPAVLLALINVGYSLSASTLLGENGVLMWILTSWYLAVTALFFAAIVAENGQARLAALARGCLIGGVIASLVAIVGYFRVFPSANELLLLYDRARGTFKDPNVLGAFLIFPALLALQRAITGRFREALGGMLLMALFGAAILLSFSRAAWGEVVFASLIVLILTFVTSHSPAQRLRIVLFAAAGAVLVVAFIAALLSIDVVAQLFKERASLSQSYDVGERGRFARHALGALLALDVPLGIGPLQFSKYFPEDPHNSYLNAFMSGGWLAGASYLSLVLLTLVYGLKAALLRTPLQPMAIVVYAGYASVATESVIIDSDHWRHAFMLLGLQWGLIAATRELVRGGNTAVAAAGRAPSSPALACRAGPA